jgi:hypothetical protein
MILCDRRMVLKIMVLALTVAGTAPVAVSQVIQAPLDQGFARSSSIVMNVEEMLGPRIKRDPGEASYGPGFPALWISEIQYKPVRMVRIPITDPATKKTANELVWYMVYRLIPRNYVDLAGNAEARANLQRRLEDVDVDPQNEVEPLRAETVLLPRFVLQTTDDGEEERYVDEVNHQAEQAIFRREFQREAKKLTLLNSIEAIAGIPEPVSMEDKEPLRSALYGVAIWRNVNPRTDFFEIEMTGFTNAYQMTSTEDGRLKIADKGVIQKFKRPGDRFDQPETEIRFIGEPQWVYLPREATFELPDAISVLGNQQAEKPIQ